MTSYGLYKFIMEENVPIDWSWVHHIKRTEGSKGLMAMARHTVECFAEPNTSNNKITRATKMVFKYLNY